jgi:transposase InsO family protein
MATRSRPGSTGTSKTRASASLDQAELTSAQRQGGAVPRAYEQEFYQLPSYKGDVDLESKLQRWERFYNLARPHGAHNGKTP